MIVKRYYKDKLPPKVIGLIEWLLAIDDVYDWDRFSDSKGSIEYYTFQLTFRKVIIVIDKTTAGYITFRLEASNEYE